VATAMNTLFLRLEGPLQSWGGNSRLVIRRTSDAPTKSGVIGLLCCAMGLTRHEAQDTLSALRRLRMAVRIDRSGERWWDYHTIGAGSGVLAADGSVKTTASTGELETLISRREYLADASFLVALQGEPQVIDTLRRVVEHPTWPVFLGRKCCPPAVPLLATPLPGEHWTNPGEYDDLPSALGAVPWNSRSHGIDSKPPASGVSCIVEWTPSAENTKAPPEAEVWYDSPISFCPPVHQPRLVLRIMLPVTIGEATLSGAPVAPRPRADYKDREYAKKRTARLDFDAGLCVFCKAPAVPVHHITYRRAGGNEAVEDLRSLCRLCHDAITMIEYGHGMGLDRINPEDIQWRPAIIEKRQQIIEYRSLEIRRRRLSPEEVE